MRVTRCFLEAIELGHKKCMIVTGLKREICLEKKSGESRRKCRDFRIMDSLEHVVLGKISQGLIIIDI